MGSLTLRIVCDIIWLASAAYFGYNPSGPAGVICLACFILYLTHGAPRFQLWPSYAVVPLAALSIYFKGLCSGPAFLLTLLPYLTTISLLLACAVHAVLPHTVSMPRASGPHATALHVVRLQSHARGVDFNTRIYYPCVSTHNAVRVPYLYSGSDVATGIATYARLPAFLLTWTQYLKSNVYDADLNATRVVGTTSAGMPVIVFSHGLGGTPDLYSALITDLTSRGYVLVVPEHADGSGAFTRFADGFKREYQPLTPAERASRPKEYRRRHAQLQLRSSEVRAALDLVAALAGGVKQSPEGDDMWFLYELLAGKVSSSHVYVAGHSFGAATAIAVADVDPRVRAVIALDPWMMPLSAHTLKRGLPRTPVLAVCGDGFTIWRENAEAMRVLLTSHTRAAIVAADVPSFDKSLEASLRAADAHAARRRTPKATLADSDDEVDAAEGSVHAIGNGVARGGVLHASLVAHPQGVHARHVLVSMAGVEHINFSDLGILLRLPARLTRSIGPADPVKVLRTIGALSAEFLLQVDTDAAASAPAPAAAAVTLQAHNSPWSLRLASVPHPDLLTQAAWMVAGAEK